MIRVVGPRDLTRPGEFVVDTTSRSASWSRGLSPFLLGPVETPDGPATNVENAWQFSKVYPEHDAEGVPSAEWFEWRRAGFANPRAVRYPMGKGRTPVYSWWNGQAFDYVPARNAIYLPIYAAAVLRSAAWTQLRFEYQTRGAITLWDFDGYDFNVTGKNVLPVFQSQRRCGHAFVLAALLVDAWAP